MFNFKETDLYNNFKKYYSDKNLIIRYFIIFFIILIVILQLIKPRGLNKEIGINSNITTSYGEINFADEQTPFDGRYFYNQERLDREIFITQINKEQFVLTYKRQGLYIPYIESQLKKAGLPDDLKYIPMIESYLRNSAVSSAGAAGIRQLMPATAIKYGLVINDYVDERYDAFKSTDAAIKYFQDIYPIFNNRTLTIAAYNRGENGLFRDMESQGQNNYYDLYLNNETYRFVFRALAMKYLMENKDNYFDSNFFKTQYENPETKTISVSMISDLTSRANENGYTYLEIKQLNPRIKKSYLPEGNREIKVFKK